MERPLIVGVDGSAPSLLAIDWAVDEAARLGLPLRLVHAFIPEELDQGAPTRTADSEPLSERRSPEDVVASAAARARRRGPDVKVDSEAVPGDVLSVLLAEDRHASALVTGSRGLGELMGLLLGSVGPALAVRAHCPVIVVRGDKAGLAGCHERILLGAGDPGTSGEAVRFAFREAEARGCVLDIVRAWRRPARETVDHSCPAAEAVRRHEARASALLDTLLRDVVLDHPRVRVRSTTVEGSARTQLVKRSAAADLVIIGARRGRSPLGVRTARIAHALLHHAQCPVVVVPLFGRS
ncbi:universal stress protein [Streptomyces sp. MBT65]|uniref:universal stress protein n=1 Tax=Streptomyces sp. MBT65 TaxID=1488395 RepID=UPI00190A81B1|nr:universal stress protein [Streptomyces sp. MBT65]MBK3576432.1 universal stress protein [Streptomyces sp. MBT65]